MTVRRFAALFFMLVLSAWPCWAGEPAPAAPATPAATAAPAATPVLGPPIQCLTLEDAVVLAVHNNPRVAISKEDITFFQGLLEQAKGAALPKVTIDIQRTDTASLPGTASFQATGAAWATRVSLTQPLYRWGSLAQGLKAAKELVNSTQGTYSRTQDQVAFAARAAYYQVLTGQESVRVQQDSLAAAQEHRRIAGLRFEAGVAPQYDVLAADARVASVQQVLAASEGELRNAWASLSQVLACDIPPDTGLVNPQPLAVGQTPVEALVATATENRADVCAARAQAAGLKAQLAIVKTGNLPNIDLNLGISFLPNTTIAAGGESLVVSAKTAFVGLGATWTPFDSDQTHGKVVQAEARYRQGCESVRLVQLQAEQEVKTAYNNTQTAGAQQEAASKEVAAAREAYRIAQVRYQEGVSTSVEVLDAQATLSSAQNRLNQANFSLSLAIAQLDLAVGQPVAVPVSPEPAK